MKSQYIEKELPWGAKEAYYMLYEGENIDDIFYRDQEGNLKAHKKYINGQYKTWNSRGNLMAVANYNMGVLEGEYTIYYLNGQPWAKSIFKDGKHNGRHTLYHENGQVKSKMMFAYGQEIRS